MSEGEGLSKGGIISNKLILTYKRKRLSSQSDHVQHVEGTCSPKLRISVKPESSFLTRRVEIDDTNGLECVASDNYKNMMVHDVHCSGPFSKNGTPELLQHQGESNKQKDRSTEHSDTGPMRLRSCKMLLPGCTSKIKLESNRYSEADSSITKEPCTVGNTFYDMTTGSPDKMCLREESKFHLLDSNISGNPRLENLNIPAKEKSITVLPESVPNRVISGNNELFTDTESAEAQTDVLEEKRKKKHARPFITFHRRTKKKRNACEMDTDNKQSVDRTCDLAMTCNKPSPDLKYVYAEQSDKVGQHENLPTSSELKLNTVTADTRIRPESNDVLWTEIGRSEGPSQCLQAGPLNQIVNSGVAEYQQKMPLIFMSTNSSPIQNNCNEIVPENKLLNIEPSVDRELDICSAVVSEKVEQAAVLDSMENGTCSTTNLVSSSVQNGGFLTSAHGRGNPLQCLDDLNETPLETHKEISTSLKRNGANHGQVVDLQLFNSNLVREKGPVDLLESASRGNMNHTIRSHERTSLTNSAERGSETQNYLKAEKSPLLSNFPGLAPPQTETAANFIRDFGNKPSTSSLDHRDSFIYDGRFRNPHRLSPVTSHRQIFENFMNSTRFINQGQGFPLEFKRHPRAWSEEELDSLWIGVRRHGRNNWNAMLRDRTLYFSEMRIAQDLSERWDMEQSKLFSGMAVNSVDPVLAETLSARPMFGNYQNNCGTSHHIPYFQTSRPETHLSLGHAYTRKVECFSSRKPFYFSDLGINHQLADVNRTSSSYMTDLSSRNAFWKNLGLTEERPSRDQNLSMLEPITSGKCRNFFQPYAGQPTNGNLPHWLREAVSIPPQKPRDTSLTSCVSAIAPPVISLCPGQYPASNRDPSELLPLSKDSRKCTFERITDGSRTGNPRAFDPASASSLPKQPNLTPTIGFTSLELGSQSNLSSKKNMHPLNKNSTETSLKRELVILDSDISSEETISDNSA